MGDVLPGGAATELRRHIDESQRAFDERLTALGETSFSLVTPAGWTVKELIAHIAFWEETAMPMTAFFRGEKVPDVEEWYGGVDIELGAGDPWPDPNVHNEREARWARSRSDAEVRARWDASHARLLDLLATLTDEEAADERFVGQLSVHTHYADHLSELDALLAGPPAR